VQSACFISVPAQAAPYALDPDAFFLHSTVFALHLGKKEEHYSQQLAQGPHNGETIVWEESANNVMDFHTAVVTQLQAEWNG